ncbi:hypothetical protein HMPREF9624_01800 [Oribacterium asaccharolyticum ACB7]|uniref:Glycosyltransferase RgtA/B/C/D-like domain-containing protein n=1 Tax=Oribacterium asaccharolyticum ACB7 TaxID=796944 RepID=G9WRT4_9FIRM|nr:hypothetical protein [Oribacterium asaccharolyticum]EHL14024.1 hypothetical protein HMPREF9624_01800 [Oribacterium asaccharolyticum ACB7]
MSKEKFRASFLLFVSILCTVFLGFYILSASADIVYSDYIRLTNSYLGEPFSFRDLLTKDILTRIPVSFLFREINIAFFHYSITFDRFLGLFGLFLTSIPILLFMAKRRTGVFFSVSLLLIFYSLNKWEMLLNGSGYAHFLSFALFYLFFYLLSERVGKGSSLLSLSVFPFLFLLTGGPYAIAVYGATILSLFFLFLAGKIRDKRGSLVLLLSSFVSTFLYFLSNHYAVYEYAGAKSISLKEVLFTKMTFVLKFFGFGFSSLLFSGENLEEWLSSGAVQGKQLFLLGGLILLFFLLMALLFLKDLFFGEKGSSDDCIPEKEKDKSLTGIFPALLLLHGLLSFALVFLSRYIFLRPEYAVQSRYALQYQSALLGALLLLYLKTAGGQEVRVEKRNRDREIEDRKKGEKVKKDENAESVKLAGDVDKKAEPRRALLRIISIGITLLFLGGTLHTAKTELLKAPYRRLHYETMLHSVNRIEEMDEEELERLYEYRHGKERILKAFSILKERKLNCFYGK